MARNPRVALDADDRNLILAALQILHEVSQQLDDSKIYQLASAQRMNQLKVKLGIKPAEAKK
jgi:hypothetical protein